eukprot:scaffold480_cov257-Pinguiococcus_pyrenoidosus.AAC.12
MASGVSTGSQGDFLANEYLLNFPDHPPSMRTEQQVSSPTPTPPLRKAQRSFRCSPSDVPAGRSICSWISSRGGPPGQCSNRPPSWRLPRIASR